jgi:2-polyprenyl-3-methyl-5-hydroxy-6-metoxy-1,4-benzoquinol methylase
MSISCILCKSTDTYKTGSIDTVQLSALYKQRAHTAVERFFHQPTIELYTCRNCDLIFYWPQAVGDGKFYDELQCYSGYYLKEKAEFIEAAKFITTNETVLEVGCGEGLFTDYIKCKSYTGLEFSEDAIKKAKQKGLNVINESLEQHAATHAQAYDVMCYFQVLEHVPDPGGFIADSLRCLKPGGKLLVAVPSEDSFIKNVVNFYLNMPPHHASRWTDRALKRVAELFNLEVVELFHEPLHGVHKKFYTKTILHKKIMNLLGMQQRAVDNRITTKISYAIAHLTSYLPFRLTLKKSTGQSVLIAYRKQVIY